GLFVFRTNRIYPCLIVYFGGIGVYSALWLFCATRKRRISSGAHPEEDSSGAKKEAGIMKRRIILLVRIIAVSSFGLAFAQLWVHGDQNHSFKRAYIELFDPPEVSDPLFSISGKIVPTGDQIIVYARGRENRHGNLCMVFKDKPSLVFDDLWAAEYEFKTLESQDAGFFLLKDLPAGVYDLAVLSYGAPYVSRVGHCIGDVANHSRISPLTEDALADVRSCVAEFTMARSAALAHGNPNHAFEFQVIAKDYEDMEARDPHPHNAYTTRYSRMFQQLASRKATAGAREERHLINAFGNEQRAYVICVVDLVRILRETDLLDHYKRMERLDLVRSVDRWIVKRRHAIDVPLIVPSLGGPRLERGHIQYKVEGSLVGIEVGPDVGNVQLPPIELTPAEDAPKFPIR
ncbi:MAG: hypothetical protein ABIH23_12800, partial [bacterium]